MFCRLTQVNGEPVVHDANVTAFGADRYTWNTRDELVGLTRPGLTASFAYDVFGRRHTKTINNTATTYLSDGDEVVAEYAPNGTPTYTLHSPFIDEPIRRGDAYLTPDRLGSTTTLTDEVGTVVERYAYLPFGETLASVGPAQSNPYQFTGRENDGTGLMYYRARYYAPEWGRFVSEDPIGLAGGGNIYSYAGGDPVNNTDPSGLDLADGIWKWLVGLFRTPPSRGTPTLLSPYRDPELESDETVGGMIAARQSAVPAMGRGAQRGLNTAGAAVIREVGVGVVLGAVKWRGGKKSAVKAPMSQPAKRRLAKRLGGIARNARPVKQGRYRSAPGYGEVTKWWEYRNGQGQAILIVEHSDGSVHVGIPKADSQHISGGKPKYIRLPGVPTHIGGE